MRVFSLALVVVLLIGLVASSATAQSKAERAEREQAILALLGQIDREIRRADHGCRSKPPARKPTFTDAAPSDALVSTLGVLGRPESAADMEFADEFDGAFLPAEDIYRRHIRIASTAGDREVVIVAARNTNIFDLPPRRCVLKLRARFERRTADRPRRFRRQARRVLRLLVRSDRVTRKQLTGPREGVFLLTVGSRNSFALATGGVGADFIKRRGLFSSYSDRRSTLVTGLVPDPVAEVTAILARERPRGQRTAMKVRRTLKVRNNVVSFTVGRSVSGLPKRMIWRDASGRVVRVVKGADTW